MSEPARGGFLDDVAAFDAAFFGVSPREAQSMDPQQRLALELGWEALENARIRPERLHGHRTGVYIGATVEDYAVLVHQQGTTALDHHTPTGLNRGLIANRLSYHLGLRGPSMTLDTAQSSSLVAVQTACDSLRRGDCETALVEAVCTSTSPPKAPSPCPAWAHSARAAAATPSTPVPMDSYAARRRPRRPQAARQGTGGR